MNYHKIILSQQEFSTVYPKYDSTRTTFRECGHPLEWLDEKWMVKKYGEKDEYVRTFARLDRKIPRFSIKGFDFDSNNHLVIIDSGKAEANTFKVISDQFVLDENTNVFAFKKLFPNVEMEETDEKNKVRFRLPIAENFEAAFLFYRWRIRRLHLMVAIVLKIKIILDRLRYLTVKETTIKKSKPFMKKIVIIKMMVLSILGCKNVVTEKSAIKEPAITELSLFKRSDVIQKFEQSTYDRTDLKDRMINHQSALASLSEYGIFKAISTRILKELSLQD